MNVDAVRKNLRMEQLIREIRAAIDGGAWVLALFGTLALPDICAALGSANGETNGKKYKRWIRENLSEKYPDLEAEELYKMRCSMLHQGNSSTASYARVIFIAPGMGIKAHRNRFDDALNLDLPTFCEDVIGAAERWLSDNKLHPDVVRNSISLVRWYPGGLSPYISGVDVLS